VATTTTTTTIVCPSGDVTATLVKYVQGTPANDFAAPDEPDTATVKITNRTTATVQVSLWSVDLYDTSAALFVTDEDFVQWVSGENPANPGLPAIPIITLAAGRSVTTTYTDPDSGSDLFNIAAAQTSDITTMWNWPSADASCAGGPGDGTAQWESNPSADGG
jgi:hypothetical protein